MHARSITFKPFLTFQLTEVELEALRTMSVQHYDLVCKQASKQGGMIFGFMNRYYDGDPHGEDRVFRPEAGAGPCSWREIDTLAKICEGAQFLPTELASIGFGLGMFFSQALRAMNDAVPDELPASVFLPKYAPPADPA